MFSNFLKRIKGSYNEDINQDIKNEPTQDITLDDKKIKFENIIKFAKEVLDKTNEAPRYTMNYKEHPLFDVVRLLGRDIQTKYITELLFVDNETTLDRITPKELFFNLSEIISNDGKTFRMVIKEIKAEMNINLAKDLVLPWPWKRERLINCIVNIGEGRLKGGWKQDKLNHFVDIWLPMGIAWVTNGNHSTTVGIIQGSGNIKTDRIYDISDIYNYIKCDGRNFIRLDNGKVIYPVKNIEFASIFEIGRMMKENKITYL
jgi:hypothetical protein